MRMSCNGCRVLRKGCSDSCTIRPCLQWIKSSESQANATVFLAKFYGRAGLMNLINSGPEHLRPAIYRSLLYEACGRIVNPIYGSVGLLCSGSWPLCQAAVEAVLKGVPIAQIPSEAVAASPAPPPKAYDIPHLLKSAGADAELHKVSKSRSRFKRPGAKPAATLSVPECQHFLEHATRASPAGEAATVADRRDEECTENECTSSADTEQETSHVSQGEPDLAEDEGDEDEVALRLALGFEPVTRSMPPSKPVVQPRFDAGDLGLTL